MKFTRMTVNPNQMGGPWLADTGGHHRGDGRRGARLGA